MVSSIPYSAAMRDGVENSLRTSDGNPVDAQFGLGLLKMHQFPQGDPPDAQEQLSYLAGMARSFVGGGGRGRTSPQLDPTQDMRLRIEASAAQGDDKAAAMLATLHERDRWQMRRNQWIKHGTSRSRDGSLDGAVEVLAARYKDHPDPDILNAIRYMEGSMRHVPAQ
jgi:hypothetical protein